MSRESPIPVLPGESSTSLGQNGGVPGLPASSTPLGQNGEDGEIPGLPERSRGALGQNGEDGEIPGLPERSRGALGQNGAGDGAATAGLLLATAIWGATFVTVKDALASSDSFTFLALRFGVGAIAAVALSYATKTPPGLAEWRAVLRPGLALGVLLYGGYVLQTVGLETTTPARSAFVTGLTVIFVPFVTWRWTGQRPPVRAFIAPAIALVGLQRLTGVTFSGALPVGDLLTLGCAVLYAGHIAGTGKLGKGLPSMPLTAVQLMVVTVLSTASLPFVERRFEPTPGFWLAVVFTGVVASAVNIGVQVWAQTRISATRAAVIYSLEPVFALAWGVATGFGWPSAAELVGGAFILAAVLISEVPLRFLVPRAFAKGTA